MEFKKVYVYLTIFSINFICSIASDKYYNLELLQILFRHGARTPVDCEAKLLPFANETFYEPWGYAQLTNQGMMQEYEIGQMLRDRYSDFLPDLYSPAHVYAYASGTSRTKASLALVLAALYPPTGNLTWNYNLDWMPIPIHSNPRPIDILMKPRNCPQYVEAFKTLLKSAEIQETIAEHDDILKTLEKIYGQPFNFDSLFCAYNAVVVHKNMNLTLPNWYTDSIFNKMRKAGSFYLEALSYTTFMRRLNSGPLVRKFVENINNPNSASNRRKIYLYSAHDKNVHSFLRFHNITFSENPGYGSTIILEKLRDEKNNIYIKLLLWTGEPKKLTTLKLENCSEICPLNKYLKIVKPMLPNDEEMLCLLKNLQPKDLEYILNTDQNVIED